MSLEESISIIRKLPDWTSPLIWSLVRVIWKEVILTCDNTWLQVSFLLKWAWLNFLSCDSNSSWICRHPINSWKDCNLINFKSDEIKN